MGREEAFSSISFKLLAHDVIFGGPDGKTRSKQISEATGINYNRLSNCCNSNQVHNFTQDEIYPTLPVIFAWLKISAGNAGVPSRRLTIANL